MPLVFTGVDIQNGLEGRSLKLGILPGHRLLCTYR